MREADLVNAILLAWGSHPMLRIWRSNTGAALQHGRLVRYGVVGAADISGLMLPHGRRLEIECKSDTGKQRLAQQRYEAMITTMGGLYILARSVDDVTTVLSIIGITQLSQ